MEINACVMMQRNRSFSIIVVVAVGMNWTNTVPEADLEGLMEQALTIAPLSWRTYSTVIYFLCATTGTILKKGTS
jgi:hypothetical protein